MKDEQLAVFLRDHEAALSGAVAQRMHGHERMAGISAARGLSGVDMSTQVAGFWLKAMASDLSLGMDVALKEGLTWSLRMAAGHGLDFPPSLYTDVLETIFSVLAAHEALSPGLAAAAQEYGVHVAGLVDELVGGAR